MIHLHQYPRAFGLPNASPFCMKVETYLKLAGLEYKIEPVTNPARAPKGKAPYIVDRDKVIADSHFILKYLKETYGDRLNEGVSTLQQMHHHALARMMEEHLYFAIMYIRWIVPENASIVCDTFLTGVPKLLRQIAFYQIKRATLKGLQTQGMGRHDHKEIEQLAIEDLHVLSAALGTNEYFGGYRPREIDTVAWAFIANIITPPFKSPVRAEARDIPNLVGYNTRMAENVFPDLK